MKNFHEEHSQFLRFIAILATWNLSSIFFLFPNSAEFLDVEAEARWLKRKEFSKMVVKTVSDRFNRPKRGP